MGRKLFKRVLWQVNRSPARYCIKQLVRFFHAGEVRRRVALGRALEKSAAAIACADALARDGYAVVTQVISPEHLAALESAASQKMLTAEQAAGAQAITHKAFWTRLLDADKQNGKLPTSSAYVQFAIQPIVQQILTQAFGEVPFLNDVLLTLSQPSEAPLSYSQLWHRDHDDVRVIKLFVYLTEVAGEEDGPFTFLPGPVSDQYGYTRRSHRADDEIFTGGRASAGDMKRMIAPKLSVFMVETSRCLHMGSRLAPGHARLLYTATYLTKPCMFPGRQNNFIADVAPRDAMEQALLDLG